MVTVAQLCELQIFKDSFQLIAGKDGINKGIQHITVAEVPDFTEFDLGQDLFVLTTFFAFSKDPVYMAEAVDRLCKKNISALAIKMGRFIEKVSPEIIQIADANQVPLFLVGKDVAFRNIINDISAEVINAQLKTIKSLNRQYELLMASILNGETIESFIKTLGKNLNFYCACISFSQMILAQYSPSKMIEAEGNIDVVIKKLHELQPNSKLNSIIDGYHVFPCYVYKQTMGYLIVKPEKAMDERKLLLIKQMVSFLSIKFLEQYLQFETEQRMVMTIADQVLFQHYSDDSLVQDKLKLLGLMVKKNHFVLILSLDDEEIKGAMQFSLHAWSDMVNEFFPNSAVIFKGAEIVVIISIGDKSPYTTESGIKRALVSMLEKKGMKDDNKIMLGCSTIVNDLRLVPDCYQQAKKAIQYGKSFSITPKVFFYSRFIEQGIISHSIGTYEHELIMRKIIMPIRKYDEKYEAELWATLEKCMFIKSLENAATDLHIHSSTLRYRLQRIKDITDVDFFSPHGNFLLKLAYVISSINS